MILIQDGSQPPNIDKPLRIIGDPYKVQVLYKHNGDVLAKWEMFLCAYLPSNHCLFLVLIFFFFFLSKQRKWLMRFYETGIMQVLETGMNMDQGWEEEEEVAAAASM